MDVRVKCFCHEVTQRILRAIAIVAVAAAWCSPAAAIHFDVLVGTSAGPNPGSKLTADFYGDVNIGAIFGNPSLSGLAPIDKLTGLKIFPGDFGDTAGGPQKTDDPGFQGFNGTLGANEEVWFRGVGNLQRWDPSTQVWSAATGGEGIRLFGGIPVDVATNYLLDPTNPDYAAAVQFYEKGTLFTAAGVIGPTSAIIDDASAGGGFHAHLDWFLEPASGGSLSTGAYMVQLQLHSSAMAGGGLKYQDSDPVIVMFNYGLDNSTFSSALAARVVEIPEPHQAVLLALGLGVLGLARYRRRKV